jgi:hypothetical protein
MREKESSIERRGSDRFSPIWSATDETTKVTVFKSYNCCRESYLWSTGKISERAVL